MAVQHNQISAPQEEEQIYIRYLVCKSYSAIGEICKGELENIPADTPHFFQNKVGLFQKYLIESNPEDYRQEHMWGKSFSDQAEYSKKNPDVRVIDKTSENLFHYFEAQRDPNRQELNKNVAAKDLISSLLLDHKVSTEQISSAFAYNEVCGGSVFQEIYRLRPVWTVYLAITNITNRPVEYKSLIGEYENVNDIAFRPFLKKVNSKTSEIDFPKAQLVPKATVIVPISTLLGPLNGEAPNLNWKEMADISTGEVQTFGHGNGSNITNETYLIGPSIFPKVLKYKIASNIIEQKIHEFDLTNLYTIDRFWECGSCPHLFLNTINGKKYWGELFADEPNRVQTVDINIPEGVNGCTIVELEDEVSYISEIILNDNLLFSKIILRKDEQLSFPVKAGDSLRLSGFYEPICTSTNSVLNPWIKNEIVKEFMNFDRVNA